jgi:small subunit ribosomal protein S7
MRRKVKNRNIAKPDDKFNSPAVGKLINYIMTSGKKVTATAVVYRALDEIKKLANVEDPITVLDTALKNVGPSVEVRSRRVGGANYQVPREVRPERRSYLSMRWIIDAARSKKGKPMHMKLAEEIMLAIKGEGEAMKKRDNTHKMAEANKAFAHLAW